jgi:hypothetical protein
VSSQALTLISLSEKGSSFSVFPCPWTDVCAVAIAGLRPNSSTAKTPLVMRNKPRRKGARLTEFVRGEGVVVSVFAVAMRRCDRRRFRLNQ